MSSTTQRRLGTVVAAPLAALAAWGVLRVAGVDLALENGHGTVGAADVVSAAVVGALLGWLVARLIEQRSRQPRARWALVGSTALSVSMIGPAWLAIDGPTAVALMALHLVTGAVVIAGLAATLPVRCARPELPAARRSGTMSA